MCYKQIKSLIVSRYLSQNFINKQSYLYNIKKNKKHQPKAKIFKSIYFSKKITSIIKNMWPWHEKIND